ncbi:MAG: hypothetical protein FJX60_20240 [Alphaproteobacteria bacterium]|nr:hypothetical protein [Alphaproteobacteria bacterium]
MDSSDQGHAARVASILQQEGWTVRHYMGLGGQAAEFDLLVSHDSSRDKAHWIGLNVGSGDPHVLRLERRALKNWSQGLVDGLFGYVNFLSDTELQKDRVILGFVRGYNEVDTNNLSFNSLPGELLKFANYGAKPDTPGRRAKASSARAVHDDLAALSDGLPAKPGLGFDRIAAAFVRLLDGVVAEARDREARDDSLITVGIYGPWGSGKSTLYRGTVMRQFAAPVTLPI